MNKSYAKWLPLTGILFVAMAIVGFIVGGEPPDAASNSADEIVQFYTDNGDRVMASIIILSIATVLFVFFGSYLRSVLDRGDGEDGMFSRIAFVGAVVFAVGGAIDGTLLIAISEAAGEVEPAQIETLQAFWDNDFLPLALGIILFTLGSGISIVLHKSLPVWLGWIAIVLGIVGVTPIGWIAFMGTGVWILIVSVMLLMSERKVATPVVQ
ncbi:MAG: hypothetical protein ACRDOT_09640 [Aeromicrobium sp.]